MLPRGGMLFVFILLLLDRTFFNTDFILDVNGLVACVFVLHIANHERNHNGIETTGTPFVSGLWLVLSLNHTTKVISLKSRNELCAFLLLGAALSFTYVQTEYLSYFMLRSGGFVLCTVAEIYWNLSIAKEEPLLFIVLKQAPIMVGPWPVALAATVLPILVIAIQWKSSVQPSSTAAADPDVEAAALREALASRKDKGGH